MPRMDVRGVGEVDATPQMSNQRPRTMPLVTGEDERLCFNLGAVLPQKRCPVSKTAPPTTRGREDERRCSALGVITRSRVAALRGNEPLAVNGEGMILGERGGLGRGGGRRGCK